MSLVEQLEQFRQNHTVRSVVSGSLTWEYLKGGNAKEAILILHGGGTTSDAAWEYISIFEKDYTVIAPTTPAGTENMEQVLSGVKDVLEKEQITKVHIIGFSLGGMIAQCFIRKYPELVEDMILFVTMAPSKAYVSTYKWKMYKIMWSPSFLIRALSKYFLKKQIQSEKTKAPQEQKEFWIAFFSTVFDTGRMNKAGLVANARVLLDYLQNFTFSSEDLTDHPGHILILEAYDDKLVNPVEREKLKTLYPKAEVVTYKDSGHFGFGLLDIDNVVVTMKRFLHK